MFLLPSPVISKAARENHVAQPPHGLCRTRQTALTDIGDFTVFALHGGMTHGAGARKNEGFALLAVLLLFDDLRDDITSPLDDDVVAYTNIESFDFIGVMEGSPAAQ